ncbi:FAD-dependent oxidoreductase [Dysgonomonas sp. 25]|uniref:FAD-dependent oxidoreductase n=1 Tax=Dysgonomonas sp. 25 TaxID=2302933 RepID=UPI0013D4CF8F|nr:FAD-dependent oxidoreductase [Dysgonomonas sp. 25]NDV69694.1 FAD-dependent oxidoreductase [Dysgonomonas sp. 25]
MKIFKNITPVLFALLLLSCNSAEPHKVEILIIGGGASGTTAGIQAARMGSKTLIIEESTWLGGMLTSAGVSATDGNYRMPGGLWGEFREALANHYGGLEALKTGWVSNVLFEPSVGNKIFQSMAAKEENLDIWFEAKVKTVQKEGEKWKVEVTTQNGDTKTIEATILIDATELGDIAKMCGVKYDIGMESQKITHEDIAPAEANGIIQDLTYVAILKEYDRDMTIAKPEGYDPSQYLCTCINPLCVSPLEPERVVWNRDEMMNYGKLPTLNGKAKYMINWPLEGNDFYLNIIEMTPEERTEALKKAKNHTLCYLYFLQTELGLNNLGLADDEYPTEDKLPFIPYHRESRRIHGLVRFQLNDITNPFEQETKLYRTTIGVGDYPVDHHHKKYTGEEILPDLHFHPIPSYGLPLGTLIPKDVEGLIVAEKSISVSNIVNGTTRLQPVVLQIGQAAGTLASLAVKNKLAIHNVNVRDVQREILSANGYLMPYLDVPVGSPLFKPYQRIGAAGILRGTGKSVDWSNQTWLRADDLLLATELEGLAAFYPSVPVNFPGKTISVNESLNLIKAIAEKENIELPQDIEAESRQLFEKYGFGTLSAANNIKRGQFAVLIDAFLNPFDSKDVDIQGEIKK